MVIWATPLPLVCPLGLYTPPFAITFQNENFEVNVEILQFLGFAHHQFPKSRGFSPKNKIKYTYSQKVWIIHCLELYLNIHFCVKEKKMNKIQQRVSFYRAKHFFAKNQLVNKIFHIPNQNSQNSTLLIYIDWFLRAGMLQ